MIDGGDYENGQSEQVTRVQPRASQGSDTASLSDRHSRQTWYAETRHPFRDPR